MLFRNEQVSSEHCSLQTWLRIGHHCVDQEVTIDGKLPSQSRHAVVLRDLEEARAIACAKMSPEANDEQKQHCHDRIFDLVSGDSSQAWGPTYSWVLPIPQLDVAVRALCRSPTSQSAILQETSSDHGIGLNRNHSNERSVARSGTSRRH